MHTFTASPPNKPGYFSPQTASSNFCEIDYALTPYIAEFINTLTNFAYVYLAAATLAPGTSRFNVLSWPLTNISLLLVGLGSAAYHATLKHEAQMADELSMYAIITALNYRVYTHKWFKSPLERFILGSTLAFATAVVGYSNIMSLDEGSTRLHLALFVTLISTFWPRLLFLIHHRQSPSSQLERLKLPKRPVTVDQSPTDPKITRQKYLSEFRNACFLFILAFVVWMIDGLWCDELRAVRARVGLPLAWLTELHGAWHILTAIAAAIFVRLVANLTGEDGQS